LTSDITALESFYVRAAAPPLAALLAAGALGLFLGAFTPALAVGVLGLLALNGGLLPLFVWVGARQAGPRLVAARSDFKVQLVDSLQGFPDLWVLGRAGDFQRRALSTAAELDRLNLQAGLQNSLFDAANMLCAHAAAWLALVITLPLAAAGEISPLAVGALVLVAQASFEAVQPLALAGRQLAADQAAASRLVAISQQTPAVDETAGVGLASTERPAHLVIENLSFRYPGPASVPPVLDGLSLDLQAGRVCVLLGPSGAGKSTVVNLMLRFWDNEGGTMRVAGQDLRSLRPDAARRCFGVVPQRIHLFSASLRENLLLARPEAVEEDLHRALALAGLADLCAALPEALDTWLGETGFRLSGGERQRLGIARAVLQDAPFTIFDEPAAHLDRQAAQAVLGRVVAHLRPRGGILVLAHDLDDDLASSLGPQDEILELKNGRVGWRGSLAAFHHRRAETGSPA
jgi:ABC-type transport system involved in cytochrome bd biosynthesis fused ATPase/permease subunit